MSVSLTLSTLAREREREGGREREREREREAASTQSGVERARCSQCTRQSSSARSRQTARFLAVLPPEGNHRRARRQPAGAGLPFGASSLQARSSGLPARPAPDPPPAGQATRADSRAGSIVRHTQRAPRLGPAAHSLLLALLLLGHCLLIVRDGVG